jgi:hypothetical protein
MWEIWAKNFTDSNDQWILQDSGHWAGGPVIHSLDGLSPGKYDISVVLRSIFGTWDFDTIGITVLEVVTPVIVPVDDIEFWETNPVESITWDVSDSDPKNYTIYVNGTVDKYGPWDGSDLSFDLGGLTVGVHNITLVIIDESNAWASDTVFVTIKVVTIPSIDHPEDLEFMEGYEGMKITWVVSDTYPDKFDILINSVMNLTEPWSGDNIVFSLDGFTAGEYNITLIVYSESGPTASDSVTVTITEDSTTTTATTTTTSTTTTTDTTDPGSGDPTLLIVGIGSACGVGVILILLILKKRKG